MARREGLVLGDELVSLYIDVARVGMLGVTEVAGPTEIMRDATREFGIEDRASVSQLDISQLAQIGSQGLQAYFSKNEQEAARIRLKNSQDEAAGRLRDFLTEHHNETIRATQIVDTHVPQIMLPNETVRLSVKGKLDGVRSARYGNPSLLIRNPERCSPPGGDVIIDILRSGSLTPRHRVEFL